MVSNPKPRRGQPGGTSMNVAGAALQVDERTSATLTSKKACAASAVMLDDSGIRPRPSRRSTQRHSCGCDAHSTVMVAAATAASSSGSSRRTRRVSRSNNRTQRLATRQSSSNHASDARRRHRTAYALERVGQGSTSAPSHTAVPCCRHQGSTMQQNHRIARGGQR